MTREGYVSADVVADHLQIARRQVLALTRKGRLPAHPVDPNATRRTWRFKLSEVDAAVAANDPNGALFSFAKQSDNPAGSPRSQRG